MSEDAVQPAAVPEGAPAAAPTVRSKVPLVAKGQAQPEHVIRTKASLDALGDGDDADPFGASLSDNHPKVDEGADDMLFRAGLYLHLDSKPDNVPPEFWNPRHNCVDIDAAIAAAKKAGDELSSLKGKHVVPEAYTVPQAFVGLYGEESAAEVPIVQTSAAAARELGLTQQQYEKFIGVMLNEVAGEAYLQREEAEYVGVVGDELKAAQKTQALYRWVNEAFNVGEADGKTAERIRGNGEIARDLMRSAKGRIFLEDLYIGRMNQWLRNPTSRGEIDTQRSEYETEAKIIALRESPEYWTNPAIQAKVTKYYERKYGNADAASSRERK